MFARPPLHFRQIRLRAASGSNESYAKMLVVEQLSEGAKDQRTTSGPMGAMTHLNKPKT
jgi:hypothetical protein